MKSITKTLKSVLRTNHQIDLERFSLMKSQIIIFQKMLSLL